MDEKQFQSLAHLMRAIPGEYSAGYQSGIRRHYYGERFGKPEEHEAKLRKTDEFGQGYRDGFEGKLPPWMRQTP